MKTRAERKINKAAKHFNRDLKNDIFAGRFYIHQYQKARLNGISWFLYELRDREQPERNCLIPGWLTEYDFMRRACFEMNDFIICSDFWSKYNGHPEAYNKENDKYLA